MIPIDQIHDPEVKILAARAQAFLASQRWCKEVASGQLARATAGVLGIFQFALVPTRSDVDTRLWIVVGDLPPAYLVLDDAPTWREALAGYVDLMEDWVAAVRSGSSVDDLVPVDVSPTTAHAELLATRLGFIREKILAVDSSLLESDV